jgi:hypothetical protein
LVLGTYPPIFGRGGTLVEGTVVLWSSVWYRCLGPQTNQAKGGTAGLPPSPLGNLGVHWRPKGSSHPTPFPPSRPPTHPHSTQTHPFHGPPQFDAKGGRPATLPYRKLLHILPNTHFEPDPALLRQNSHTPTLPHSQPTETTLPRKRKVQPHLRPVLFLLCKSHDR